jgi:hypothetical protein
LWLIEGGGKMGKIVRDLEQLPLRSPEEVMKPERLGAFRLTNLSFSRSILRKVMKEQWDITREKFALDENGYGEAVYKINTEHHTFQFIVFSHELPDEERNDRVISERWDVTFALCEYQEDEDINTIISKIKDELPKQESGRGDTKNLVWSRANKSTRVFEHVINSLTNNKQPDLEVLSKTGYLLRTTAVYGNGKFGIAPFERMDEKHPLRGMFRAQMFAVYLIRHFSFELVEHLAQSINPSSSKLDNRIKRYLGIGNATGLGMVPFLISHPKVINSWISMKEHALARVKRITPSTEDKEKLMGLLTRSIQYFAEYPLTNPHAFTMPIVIQTNLVVLLGYVKELYENHTIQGTSVDFPWEKICDLAKGLGDIETEELLNSLIIELYLEEIEDLEDYSVIDETTDLDSCMRVSELKQIMESQYSWALSIDFDDPKENKYFWYRSIEKEEPRTGVRGEEPGEDREMALGIAYRVQSLYKLLETVQQEELIAAKLVLKHPEQKAIITRIQSLRHAPYAEIHGNLLGDNFVPLHLLRCKLSFFGAERFDPKSNRWVRITLFQGAPLIEDFHLGVDDDWIFPNIPMLEVNRNESSAERYLCH